MANEATAHEVDPMSLYEELGQPDEPADDNFVPPFDDPNAEAIVPAGWTTGEPQEGDPMPETNAPAEQPQEAVQEAPVASTPPVPVENVPAPEEPAQPAQEERQETELSAKELSALKQRLRAAAERKVISAHRDEYEQYASDLFAKEGLEFTRRKSDAERAQEQIAELLKKHPELAETIGK